MKTNVCLGVLGCVLGLALGGGCQSSDVDREATAMISPYEAITLRMTKAEVIAQIGLPTEGRGRVAIWATGPVEDHQSFVLTAVFDSNDVVVGLRQRRPHFRGSHP